jgi:phosphate transport system protein
LRRFNCLYAMRIIENEIRDLRNNVLDMAELVLLQFDLISVAIKELDYEIVKVVRNKEKNIDKFDVKIDRDCERIIALYQPLAKDLRFVFSVLKINAYLEQIGDIINGIARKILDIKLPHDPQFLVQIQLDTMLNLCRNLVAEALSAFFNENGFLARTIFEKDDAIDTIHREAFPLITEQIVAHPQRTSDYIQLHLIIKSVEKIADFAVSIAEEAIFHHEGVMFKHSEMKASYKQSGRLPATS